MADVRTITLRQGHGTASTIVLRALPIPDLVTTTIVLYGLHATPATIILRNPLTIPEGGGGPTIIESTASSSGSATASGDSGAIWHVEAVSAGASSVSGLAASIGASLGSSTGVAATDGIAASLFASTGDSAGLASTDGVSGVVAGSVGASSGVAAATGVSVWIGVSVGTSAGAATADGLGGSIWSVAANSDGLAVCLGESETIVAGPPPAGTVPIRYIVGETANVVPVVTVLVWDFGVVSVREYVGPAHVVPVREVTTEYPHTKILKV